MTLRTFAYLSIAAIALPAFGAEDQPVAGATTSKEKPLSVVRVNVTNQPYDFFRPWSKRAPYQRRAVGAVLPDNHVLVTGEMVANATYVELEKPDSGDKTPAAVEVVDYESNLALVKPADEKFLQNFKPLKVEESKIGDELAVWQLEGNGTLVSTRALLTTADVSRYPIDDTSLLIYRLTSALQPRDGSYTTPIVKGEDLTAMLLRFDSRTQNIDAIPAPVIAHFLHAAEDKAGYHGFPRAGLNFSPLRDPQLRRFAGIKNGNGGVYITQVQKGSAADDAGIQRGDVLMNIGDIAIDQDGNYADERYGKVSVINLLSTKHFDGDTVPFKLVRSGTEMTVNVKLRHPLASDSIIEPYVIDRGPHYYVLGGLVLEELSRQFLKEWGPEWGKKAPERFVYYDRYQSELFKNDPRKRIIIISHVLPSPCTVGYEELTGLVVKKVNGVELKSLSDIEAALQNPVNGFHHIELQENPHELVLDAAQVKEIEPALMKNYGLQSMKRLD